MSVSFNEFNQRAANTSSLIGKAGEMLTNLNEELRALPVYPLIGTVDGVQKNIAVVPVRALEIAEICFGVIKDSFEQLGATVKTLVEIRSLTENLKRGINKIVYLGKTTYLINLATAALLTAGLVGSFVTQKEEYKEYTKTRWISQAMLVTSLVLTVFSAVSAKRLLSVMR